MVWGWTAKSQSRGPLRHSPDCACCARKRFASFDLPMLRGDEVSAGDGQIHRPQMAPVSVHHKQSLAVLKRCAPGPSSACGSCQTCPTASRRIPKVDKRRTEGGSHRPISGTPLEIYWYEHLRAERRWQPRDWRRTLAPSFEGAAAHEEVSSGRRTDSDWTGVKDAGDDDLGNGGGDAPRKSTGSRPEVARKSFCRGRFWPHRCGLLCREGSRRHRARISLDQPGGVGSKRCFWSRPGVALESPPEPAGLSEGAQESL